MNFIKSIWNKITGKKKTKVDGLVIKFDKDANDQPDHGSIYASNSNRVLSRFNPVPVRFVFDNLAFPPDLDEEILAFIFSEARRAGYEPKSIRSYRGIAPVIDAKTGMPAVKRQMPNRSMGERETTIGELCGMSSVVLTDAGRALLDRNNTPETHAELRRRIMAAGNGVPFGQGPDGTGVVDANGNIEKVVPPTSNVVGQNQTGNKE